MPSNENSSDESDSMKNRLSSTLDNINRRSVLKASAAGVVGSVALTQPVAANCDNRLEFPDQSYTQESVESVRIDKVCIDPDRGPLRVHVNGGGVTGTSELLEGGIYDTPISVSLDTPLTQTATLTATHEGTDSEEVTRDQARIEVDSSQSGDDGTDEPDGAFTRFESQVTDGTYVVVDEARLTTPGFVSVHIARPEEGIADVGFINPENGEAQNAAATIIGFSEFLEPGTYENVHVPLFEDEELDAVSGEIDRLPEPAVLVSLPHEDSNGNREWDFYDETDEDPAYDFGDTTFAPPLDRPTDIAGVVPLAENTDQFEISR